MSPNAYWSASGSSPLSRGIRSCDLHELSRLGIIPALAGNTEGRESAEPQPGDHPRSRGEYIVLSIPSFVELGSSPLSRGIHMHDTHDGIPARIIPALAGNTPGSNKTPSQSRDHPRSRGEYPIRTWRVWVVPWIIPALAGNTLGSSPCHSARQDHPRSRGEYLPSFGDSAKSMGSSPLSRGILVHEVRIVVIAGIIPALAGNTFDAR